MTEQNKKPKGEQELAEEDLNEVAGGGTWSASANGDNVSSVKNTPAVPRKAYDLNPNDLS